MNNQRMKYKHTLKQNRNVVIESFDGNNNYIVKIYQDKKLVNWVPYYSLVGAKKYIAKNFFLEYHDMQFELTSEPLR